MSNLFRIADVEDAEAIYDYLHEKLSGDFMAWPRQKAVAFITWYIKSKLCGISEADGKLTAVVMGRPVKNMDHALDSRFSVDWTGDTLWVQCVVSDEGMSQVWEESISFLRSWGCHFTSVAWMRAPKDYRIREFPIGKIEGRIRASATA